MVNDAELYRVLEALLRETPRSLFRDQLVDVLKVNTEVLSARKMASLSARAEAICRVG